MIQLKLEASMSDEGTIATPAAVEAAPVVESAPEVVAESVATTEPVTTEPVVVKEDPKIASRLAHLTKKEKELRQRDEELKVRLKELEAGNERMSVFETKKQKAKENPIEILRELGLEFDDVVNFVTEQGGVPPPPDPIKQELEALRATIEVERKEREKLVKEAEDAKLAKKQSEEQAMYTNYVNTLQKDMENYPLTKVYTPIDQVVEIVDRHYQDTGNVLTNEQVLQLIEAEWEVKLEAIKDIPKVKERFGFLREVAEAKQEKGATPVESATKPAVTLSNKVGSGVVTKSLDEMDLDERKALAASMLKKANKK